MLQMHPTHFIFLIMFSSGVTLFIMTCTHILSTLISLEFMTLALFFIFTMPLLVFYKEFFISFVFLTLAVCEGALGLSILILFSRVKGNELLKSSSSLMW